MASRGSRKALGRAILVRDGSLCVGVLLGFRKHAPTPARQLRLSCARNKKRRAAGECGVHGGVEIMQKNRGEGVARHGCGQGRPRLPIGLRRVAAATAGSARAPGGDREECGRG